MLLHVKRKSLNILNSNSNLNFSGTHFILGKMENFKFCQFGFEFCWHPCYFRKLEKFRFSQFEFQFCWHPCDFRKEGKVQILSIRIRIRILLASMLFWGKGTSVNFLYSVSNWNFAGTHVFSGKRKSLNILYSNSNLNFNSTHVVL